MDEQKLGGDLPEDRNMTSAAVLSDRENQKSCWTSQAKRPNKKSANLARVTRKISGNKENYDHQRESLIERSPKLSVRTANGQKRKPKEKVEVMDYVSNLEETRLQWLENFGRRYFWLLALVVMALVALVVLRSFRLADDSMGGEYAQYALMGLIASLVGLNTHVLRIFSGGNKRSRKDKAPPSRSSSDEKEGESE